ncbi:MAG TPA: hypothetical protein VJZ26_13795 [Blastocatellia bacterium]|nr:hypothetical protein [Blastocatellia bacterium]
MAVRKIVFTSRLREGNDAEQGLLEELKKSFPSDTLRGIDGLEEITVCQGNGIFAAIFEYDGDFEKIFSDYISNPAVRAFHAKIAPFLKDALTSARPADLPIAGDVLVWDGKRVMEAVG